MTSVAQQEVIKQFIKDNPRIDRFEGTFLSGVQVLSNYEKGDIGEWLLTDKVRETTDFPVHPRKNSQHDLVINYIETETKIAFCPENGIIWNPIVITNDWGIIVFIFCKPNLLKDNGVETRYWYCTKKEAVYYIKNNPDQHIWRLRDTGSDNTYIVGASLKKIEKCPLFKEFSTWDGTIESDVLIKAQEITTLDSFF